MTLEALGNLGDFVAAIATLATIVYLSIQIRQNTEAVRLAASRDLSTAIQASFSPVYQPGYPGIWRRGLAGAELDEEERAVLELLLDRVLYTMQTVVDQNRSLPMDPEVQEASLRLYQGVVFSPGGRRYWERNAARFSPSMRAFLEDGAET
jgi:hypothetical protein